MSQGTKDREDLEDSALDNTATPMSFTIVNNFSYEPFVLPGVDGDAYKAWNDWYQGLEHIFEASNTPQAKKFSTLLSYGGKELRSIYSSISNGKIPRNEDFETAIEKLEGFFKPKQHGTYLRLKFWDTEKESNESIDDFVTKLYEKKRHCDFGSTKEEIDDFVMTDKFIRAMPQHIKQELIRDRKLTFESAVRQAKEIESSRNQARELSVPNRDKPFMGSVNRLWEQKPIICFRCNSPSHKSSSPSCPARNAICRDCKMPGHYADSKFCKDGKGRKREAPRRSSGYERPAKRQKFQVRNVYDDEEIVCNVNAAGVNVVCKIEGLWIRMLVDSGTNRNIIDEKTWKLMLARGFQPKQEFYNDHIKFMGYGNRKLNQVSAFKADISADVNGKRHIETVNFYVIENGSQPLLSKGNAIDMKRFCFNAYVFLT